MLVLTLHRENQIVFNFGGEKIAVMLSECERVKAEGIRIAIDAPRKIVIGREFQDKYKGKER